MLFLSKFLLLILIGLNSGCSKFLLRILVDNGQILPTMLISYNVLYIINKCGFKCSVYLTDRWAVYLNSVSQMINYNISILLKNIIESDLTAGSER